MELSLEAKEAIRGAVEDMIKQFPDILGIDEIIPGCQVFSLDPFGVGVGVFPRYLEVGLRGTAPAVGLGTGYRVHVLFRGGLTLAVGDYVTVVHMRDADRYEVLTAGGAAGTVSALPDHDHSAPGVGGANLREIEEFEFEDAALLTIDAGGAITRTRVYHRVDTFGGAASDDLVTINGGVEGDLLIIHSENVARTVVVKHGAGNIWLAGSVDYTFDDTRHHLTLLYNGASWSDISSIGSTAGGAPVDAQYLVLALNAALTAERRFDPMAWLGAVDGGVNADYDLSFYPDLPVVIGTGAIPLEYATIQAAINAAAAGQTVLVPPSTYAEDITLKDGVLVVGWGAREDIRITGDESIVTTASGGHLENVTVDADAPGAGAYRGAVLFNSAGICTFRGVRIEMTSNASVTGACGIHTIGANAGTLNAHDVEIVVSTNQDNSMACGIRITGTYVLYLADFSIDAANTGIGSGGYGACTIGIMTTGTGVVETRHGKIAVAGASVYSYYNSGTSPLAYYVHRLAGSTFGTVVTLVDLSGSGDALVLDADGDTSLSAPTDDQIDVEIGGTDRAQWIATALRGTGASVPNLGTTTAAEKWGHIYLAGSKELYPDTDGRGLFARTVNRLGIATYTNHFRSVANGGLGAVIPTGFTWRGAPFGGTPAALNYNRGDDFFAATADGAGTRHFLADDVANVAASWQNKSIYGRIRTGVTTEVGFRLDDGTDDNYAEIYMTGVLANATQRLDFRYRTAAGAVTTVSSGIIIPCDTFVVVRLFCYWSGATYAVNGYLITEDGDSVNVTGFTTGVVAWMPAAGRVGFMVKNAGNYGIYDWFYHDFGLA